MGRELTVGGRRIADDEPCFVIAEIGHNHQGDIDQAKALIDAAHDAGVDAVKLQKRDNRTLFTREFYDQVYNSENAFGETYGEHREFLEFGHTEYEELKTYAERKGLVFFATAFDHPSADFLADLDVPAFKIASGDLTNIPLLRHVASFGKPMFISTGGGHMDDVVRAFEAIAPLNDQLCIMQCTAAYPPDWDQLNLRVIDTFRDTFPEVVIGFSSHDNGIAMALVAYVLGARVVEKHFTLNRAMKGSDHAFSLEPQGMRKMVRDLRRADVASGDGKKAPYATEGAPLLKMSKKLVAARDLPAGWVLREGDLIAKSPGDGLPPYHLDELLGKRLVRALAEEDPIELANVEGE